MVEPSITKHLQRKQAELHRWLRDNAPDIELEQAHLRQGTAERAYWHYGYYVALRDIQTLMSSGSTA